MIKNSSWRMVLLLILLACLIFFTVSVAHADKVIIQLTIEDVIGPATDDYVGSALQTASDNQTELVVIRLDTPGGLDSAMRSIIKKITNSPVPVAVYVFPSGARAASAGTYLLYASHIAAMSPGTNLGAATPITLGGISPSELKKEKNQADKPVVASNEETMKRKMVNDAVSYIRSLAQLRGRNEQWAEKSVRESVSLPAKEALKLNVIDIVAVGMADLLKQIDGREVLIQGQKKTIRTAGLVLTKVEPDWRNRLLSVITNPNIAYILMLVGIYGLIFEFSNPGAIIPGTVGGICLLLALYAFQLLPINYAGMGLILLGIALMVGEAFEPSFGMLGIGGLIAFVFGSIILMDTTAPGYGIDISVIATFAISSIIMFSIVIGMAIKARRRPVVSGMDELLGSEALVIDDFENDGKVKLHSEIWNAHSDSILQKGQYVKVTGIKGLTLNVEPLVPSKQEKK